MKKRKWASAEQKRQHELLSQQWEQVKKKHETKKPTVAKTQQKATLNDQFAGNLAYRTRSNRHIPSIQGGEVHTYKGQPRVYTGALMKGISTLHKSNAVPIFSSEEAKEHANMRR